MIENFTDSGETAELLNTAAEWQDGGAATAVAVVVRAWNSAPRPPGSRMLIREDGVFAGSVSGGCVEKEVMFAAQECLRTAACQVLSFGVSDETAWQSGLSCGGQLDVLVAPFPAANSDNRNALEKLHAAIDNRRTAALTTNSRTGEIVFYDDLDNAPEAGMQDEVFCEHFLPRRRAAIVGAAHIAQELIPMLSACGFEVVLIDPRKAWASAQRFPDVEVSHLWPDEALWKIHPDFYTAVIALTHDPKIDDPALLCALRTDEIGYVGALGSTRTHEKRKLRLKESGLSDEVISCIHAPVGENIGAKTAAEIAVSIAAQVISFYRQQK